MSLLTWSIDSHVILVVTGGYRLKAGVHTGGITTCGPMAAKKLL